MKKIIFFIVSIIVATVCLSACKISSKTTELTESEKEIMSHYVEPSIDGDFADDSLLVILKNAYSSAESISFADFKIADIDKIAYIRNLLYIEDATSTIYAGTNDVLQLKEKNVHSLQSNKKLRGLVDIVLLKYIKFMIEILV